MATRTPAPTRTPALVHAKTTGAPLFGEGSPMGVPPPPPPVMEDRVDGGDVRVDGGDVRYVKNEEESEPHFSQPSLFRPTPLTRDEIVVDGRIRTASVAVLAATCLCFAVYYLKAVLVPFVIALALKFLLTPIIDFLSCAHCNTPGSCKLPRGIATILSFVLVIWIGSIIVSLVTSSASKFMEKADVYTKRLTELVDLALKTCNAAAEKMGRETSSLEALTKKVETFLSNVSVSDVIIQILGEVGSIAEEALCEYFRIPICALHCLALP